MRRQLESLGIRNIMPGIILTLASVSLTGCQVDIGGQTLPSPYYIYDDVQYFPAGSEFKLSEEAAAMKAQQADVQIGP